jgi:hypothetical protein
MVFAIQAMLADACGLAFAQASGEASLGGEGQGADGQEGATPDKPEAQPEPAPRVKPQDSSRRAPTQAQEREAKSLGEQAQRAFGAGELDKSQELLRRQIELTPDAWVPRYNLACALGAQDRPENAAEALQAAIARGFFDLRRLEREPTLASARELEPIKTMRKGWGEVIRAGTDARLAEVQRVLGPKPASVERDEGANVVFVSWADARVVARAREELALLAKWGERTLFDDLTDAQKIPDATVIVALPRRDAFQRWSRGRFGSAAGAFAQVGGSYEPEHARLVSIDLGASLRHEFFHALHYRMLTRWGQTHPMWILEGLASLVEDVEPAGSVVRPVASWRTNAAKRLLGAGQLPDLGELIALDQAAFSGGRPLAKYAHARAFFLYLHDAGTLKPWFELYVNDADKGYRADHSGVLALEASLAKPLAQIDKDFRAWLKDLPDVAEQILAGMASLGVEVENGSGDGVVVAAAPRATRGPFAPNPLRKDDVILEVAERPTRDIPELIRVLGSLEAGKPAKVRVRRGDEEKELEVTLTARK